MDKHCFNKDFAVKCSFFRIDSCACLNSLTTALLSTLEEFVVDNGKDLAFDTDDEVIEDLDGIDC